MPDRTKILTTRMELLAMASPADAILTLGAPASRLTRGPSSLQLRCAPDALPLAPGVLAVVVAPEVLRAAAGPRHGEAFTELLRAVRPEGRAVIAEDDRQGTVGAEHALAVKLGWVPSQMEAIPDLAPDKVRLFVIFKPPAEKAAATTSAERGHKTH